MIYLEKINIKKKNTMDCFEIKGIKIIRVRKDRGKYYTFDLNSMEIIELNETGTEILFLINKNKSLLEIEQYFKENYDVEDLDIRTFIKDFLNNLQFKNLIMNILVKNNIYLELLD
ncbi:PqqD family protein [Vagococcus fluvialis]|uniref:PqqD family protein n=1 Tax=Vagococcus fluvialis TaxID=2738 RepID=UPI003790242E